MVSKDEMAKAYIEQVKQQLDQLKQQVSAIEEHLKDCEGTLEENNGYPPRQRESSILGSAALVFYTKGLIVQRIEHRSSKPTIEVRFLYALLFFMRRFL